VRQQEVSVIQTEDHQLDAVVVLQCPLNTLPTIKTCIFDMVK